jgi:tetratricopeptide (TPR) repeat protein
MKSIVQQIAALQTSIQTVILGAGLVMSGCASTPEKPAEKPVEAVKAAAPKLDSTAALIADAGRLLKEGKAAEAKAKYDAVLVKEPTNTDARVGLAQSQLKLGDFDGAKATAMALQKDNPDSKEAPMLLGLVYKEKGDYDSAIDLYEKELEKQKAKGDVPDSSLLNNLIVMYRAAKQYDKGEKICATLLSRDPDNADALKNLSLIYFDQGKYQLAETIAVNSLRLNDKDAALYNNRGMIRVKRGRYPEAMSFFNKAVQIDPTNIAAHLNIGAVALRYRDYQTASKHYSDAMKLEPRHPQANLGYGLALSGLAGALPPDQQPPKAQEAIVQLERAVEIDATLADAFGEIAMIQRLQLQKPQDAKASCGKYLAAKGAGLADTDIMKVQCKSLDDELAAGAAAERMKEQMRQQEEADKANAPPAPVPAPAAPPAG